MSMVFLAGVANCEIFDGDELVASARTLIDSSITIGVTLEELRGGQGNALWGKYAHTSTFDLKITDAMFNINYLAMNVGADVGIGGDVFKYEQLKSDGTGKITLSAVAVPIMNASQAYAYIRPASKGDASFQKYVVQADNTVTGLENETDYCVRYMFTDSGASMIKVNSNFIPSTLSIVLTANLFSGDACNVNTATNVGSLTIKVPRFQLNGNQELAMTASGISNTAFEGSALASGCSSCDDTGVYAEIIQSMFNEHWYTNAQGLIVEDNYVELETGAFKQFTPVVYAWYSHALPKMISNDILKAQNEKSTLKFAVVDAGTTGLSIDAASGAISGSGSDGTAIFSVSATTDGSTPIEGLDASLTVKIGE